MFTFQRSLNEIGLEYLLKASVFKLPGESIQNSIIYPEEVKNFRPASLSASRPMKSQ